MSIHFCPEGGFFGDPIPFFWKGKYHIFYLKDLLKGKKRGSSFVWGHIVSSNLIDWEELPTAIPLGKPGRPDDRGCATGSIVYNKGKFYIFYTGFPQQKSRKSKICMATSKDLIHWEKHEEKNPLVTYDSRWYASSDWRDPFVFYNKSKEKYWMLITASNKEIPKSRRGVLALATSNNLLNWEVKPPLWSPATDSGLQCPDLLHCERGKFILLSVDGGITKIFKVSSSGKGLWEFTKPRVIDPWVYAIKTLDDGKRHLAFGWIHTRLNSDDEGKIQWGGDMAIPREIKVNSSGKVSVCLPKEYKNFQGKKISTDFKKHYGKWESNKNVITGKRRGGFGCIFFREKPRSFKMKLKIELTKDTYEAGILLRMSENLNKGYKISIEPEYQRIAIKKFETTSRGSLPYKSILVQSPLHNPTEREIVLNIFVDESIVEIFADEQYSIGYRLYDKIGEPLGFYVINGKSYFKNFSWSSLENI